MNAKNKYIQQLIHDYEYSLSKFDSQTLVISGGALGFSLTFISDIVVFQEAIYLILLYIALGCFILAIFIGFTGHYFSMQNISKSIDLATEEKYDEIKPDLITPKINCTVLITLSLGILLMVSYCIVNIENQRKIINETENSKELLYKEPTAITTITDSIN